MFKNIFPFCFFDDVYYLPATYDFNILNGALKIVDSLDCSIDLRSV